MERLFSKYKKDQVVIYGDILGFKRFIYENAQKNNIPIERNGLRCYVDVFHYLDTRIFTDEFRRRTGINFIWLSDSFAFAGDITQWEDIKTRFINFACELFCMGFVFKGSITFGDMHNEENMMGLPLVEAVNIEKKLHMPKIAVSEKALSNIPFLPDELYNECGKDFFDYLYILLCQRASRHCFVSTFNVISNVCFSGLNNEERIRKKYINLIRRLKKVVVKLNLTSTEDILAIENFMNKVDDYQL